jgi:hypothetical protein
MAEREQPDLDQVRRAMREHDERQEEPEPRPDDRDEAAGDQADDEDES